MKNIKKDEFVPIGLEENGQLLFDFGEDDGKFMFVLKKNRSCAKYKIKYCQVIFK
tara:strand:- start:4110 stop:4274 length:165 start_codon:yes stop_codon:yes gene_type:complete